MNTSKNTLKSETSEYNTVGDREKMQRVRQGFLHPVHARYHGEEALPGIRLANAIIEWMGSWPFLILQTILCGVWILLNVVAWFKHFDPYPFILLNLAFSTQAAYAAPLILMASNVASAKDRELWENDYATNQKAYEKIEELERQIKTLVEGNHELLKLMVEQKNHSDMVQP